MKTTLSTRATERGTYAIVHTFLDESGNPVTPNNGLTWTLTDCLGNVVNGRQDVGIAPNSRIEIVLSGPDLVLDRTNETYYDTARKVLIKGTYDSISYGNNLPIVDEIGFYIEGVIALAR